ncbi:hypothetical protein ACOZB2_33100 [Pantoea endophytica]|uniref:Uncharacterized protein n=1 Tax=Pantoea sp. BJ2 TaxID=3141322 RepID=A0AAU7U290_9GAMM
MKTLLIYGATGYTGHMTAAQAKSASLNIIIAAETGRGWEYLPVNLTSVCGYSAWRTLLKSRTRSCGSYRG